MQLQIFQYDIFRRHARTFIEAAVIHQWKTSQDVMLQQRLSEEEKVILGGDMRADSPGIYILLKLQNSDRCDSVKVIGRCHETWVTTINK